MRSIRVTLQRDEELTADFLDLFSKLIINNTDYIFNLHFENKSEMRYSQFYDYMVNSINLKHNGLKSITKWSEVYTCNFQCKSNNVLLLLDLSPYMLIYNFGTKTFPLKNIQEIAFALMAQLTKRSGIDLSYEYHISVYLFSIFKKEYELILSHELITQQTLEMLSNFIKITIQNSRMPYEKGLQKFSVSQMMQQVFNSEESYTGMKTMLVVSSFHEQEAAPIMLFTPNWYTYGFINTGGHFGSYYVDNDELQAKLIPGTYFKTKYVFQTKFLQNWQMTEIAKRENPALTKPVTQKNRSILFQSEGQTYTDIFDLMLVFRIVLRDLKKNKVVGGGESVISNMKDSPNRIIHKNYRIPANSFIYILRTKYVQGWEPVTLTSSLMENSKFKLRLPIRNGCYLYYEATRSKDNFAVTIYQMDQGLKSAVSYGSDKTEMSNIIQKMDRINSYNFTSILSEDLKFKNVRSHTIGWIFQFNQYQIIDYLCYNKHEWGKYFKLKSICFKFSPRMTLLSLQEFLNEIGFILGKRIFNSIFIKQSQMEKHKDSFDEAEEVSRRVMLTKLNFHGDIIEMELAFLRYSYHEITNTLQLLSNKTKIRKFKWGVVTLIPNRLIAYVKNPEMINYHLFNKQWVLKFKTIYYKNLFKIYWQEVLLATYQKFALKNNLPNEKHYYRIIQAKTEGNRLVEKIVFLKVKEPIERDNEIFCQLAVPPCLLSLVPYYQEYQSKKKAITVPELILLVVNELKRLQENIIHLIDTYQTIHFKLLKSSLACFPKLISGGLEQLLGDMYDLRWGGFKQSWQTYCSQVIEKHYWQGFKEVINLVPVPVKFLMSTELDQIEGDLDLSIDGRQYSFFLCTPYKMIYVFRKQKSLYYKVINMHYKQFSVNENDEAILQLIIKQIIFKVNEQIYCRDFRIFLEGQFKGGIVKIINNQQFTRLHERRLDLKLVFAYIDKFYLASIDNKSTEVERTSKIMEVFSHKLFTVVQEFFPTRRVNYYFQQRDGDGLVGPPFNIDAGVSRVGSELFMRIGFSNNGQTLDVTQDNLPVLIVNNFDDVLKEKAGVHLKFYLKATDNSEKSIFFVDQMMRLLTKLCCETAHEVQRVLVTRKDFLLYHLDELSFIWEEHKTEGASLELIREESGEVEVLRSYIENPVMQHHFTFKAIRQPYTELIILKEDGNLIQITYPLLMRVTKGKLQFIFRETQFYYAEAKQLRVRLEQYMGCLKNFINASTLMNELIENYELPLEPEELWMNQRANHKDNKLIVASKKKTIKIRAVTQKLMKKMSMLKQSEDVPVESVPHKAVQLVPLNLLYTNFLPLNERIPAGQSLIALKTHQVFMLGEILNLRNTYLLLNFYKKNHLVFHFEQRDEHHKDHQASDSVCPPKCRKCLFYYVFCLNPLLPREAIDKLILPHIKQALNRRLFDEVCEYLLVQSNVIQQFQESFIRGEKKDFKFQVPPVFDKDQFLNYVTQHIQFYHYRTEFKSAQEKSKSRLSETNNKSSELIRLVETGKTSSFRNISPAPLIKELIFEKKLYKSKSDDVSSPGLSPALVASLAARCPVFGMESGQYDNLDRTWLFNCKKPKWSLTERYGKTLYFLKLKFREEAGKSMVLEGLLVGRDNYLFAAWEEGDFNEFKKHTFAKRSSTKTTKTKSTIVFDIIECVGSAKFNEIEETFSFIVRACLAEYYIECYFYEEYKAIISRYLQMQKQDQQRKVKTDVNQFLKEVVWPDLIDWMNEVDFVLQQSSSILFVRHQSKNELLIKDPSVYFFSFLGELVNIITDLYKIEGGINMPIFLFCELREQKYEYWMVEEINLESIKQEMTAILSSECVKIGFIITDYLVDMHTKLGCSNFKLPNRPETVAKRQDFLKTSMKADNAASSTPDAPKVTKWAKIDLNLLKYFKDVSFKQQYKFKRSMFMHFEISVEGLHFGSYNINPAIDFEVQQYLSDLQCWLYQRMKLFRLIKNIKESNSYQTLVSAKSEERKVNFFYQLRYLNQVKTDDKARSKLSMYRLLVNLVFNDFPEMINSRESTSQQEKDSKLGKEVKSVARYRLLHHCAQVHELLEILMSSPVDYSKYQSYKGNQKFLLERWGREYISLLRQSYFKS